MLLSLAVAIVLLIYFVYHRVARRRQLTELSVGGFVTGDAFRQLRRAYEASCRRNQGGGGGSSLAVFYHGQLVAHLWSGTLSSRRQSQQPWTRSTHANAYSVANCLAGVCLARLVAEGRLDYDKPVSLYWPEFAANGKSGVTVGQLMSQTAGLAGLDEPIKADQLAPGKDQSGVNRVLAGQAPLWPPEEGLAREFHHWTWGLYADALLQRVDPRSRRLADYFREEIAEPHGLAVRIGGGCGSRARPVLNWHLLWRCVTRPEFWPSLRRLLMSLPLMSTRLRRLAANACQGALEGCDGCVAGGAVGTAEAFARLFALLAAGKIVASPAVLRRLAEPIADLPDSNSGCGCRLAIGLGTCPMRLTTAASSSWMLGSVGYGGQFVYCDLDRQLSVAFLTNSLSPLTWGDDPRCLELLGAALRCCDASGAVDDSVHS